MFPALKFINHVASNRRLLCYTSAKYKNSLGLWNEDITTEIKIKIEKHWSKEVSAVKEYDKNAYTYYVLPMFPYPSGNLHMGHVRVYSISDALARIHGLDGKNVIHPIGWDAFGLPAENAAIQHNIAPHHWTKINIESMKQQLLQLGFGFDWRREISTCDPNYYKWTQYIFLKLFERGLAYQNKAKVNWDPIDETVLADEQVDENGCSWRSGAKVESRILKQWFIKTTRYAKQLYDGLESEQLEDWKDIINLQKHWIGECNGVIVKFDIQLSNETKLLDIWTSEPYKFIHGQFITIKTNSLLLEDHVDINNLMCLNPITNSKMPVYITDNANYAPEKDVYIACPTIDKEDFRLASELNIPVTHNHSKDINIAEENCRAVEIAQELNIGGYYVNSKLKDWLISRQRYWGTPIPIIHCSNCGPVPVPYKDLPVKLPHLEFLESRIQTLASLEDWLNCKCPKCQSDAKRETDTMDTFVDSSWYYYRFLDPYNRKQPFSKMELIGTTPVNIYVGGKEHAVLHLYYARFMSHFLKSLGYTPFAEPFKKLVVQGMVMGQSYKLKASGKYIPQENVEQVGKVYKEKNTGEPVLVQWEKMSKSKYNGVNPEKLLESYGCDTTRLLILADVPPSTSRRWSDATLPGVLNWQHRLWLTIRDFIKSKKDKNIKRSLSDEDFKKHEAIIFEARNYFIATATYHFKFTNKLSVGISRLQSLTSTLRNNVPPEIIANSKEYELALASLIIMLSPITPHFGSELWSGFLKGAYKIDANSDSNINWEKNVLDQRWPRVNDNYNLSFLCKVDGADRCDLKIKAAELNEMNSETALKIMLYKESVANCVKSGILRSKFELYPSCRAILYIFTNRVQKVKKTKKDNEQKKMISH